MHLRNIYKTGELKKDATAKDFLVVRTEGKKQVKRQLKHFNLDAVISVGYRVNSKRGVQFRITGTGNSTHHPLRSLYLFFHDHLELERYKRM